MFIKDTINEPYSESLFMEVLKKLAKEISCRDLKGLFILFGISICSHKKHTKSKGHRLHPLNGVDTYIMGYLSSV